MFIFLLTPFDTCDCYYFESHFSLVLLIKMLLTRGLEKKCKRETATLGGLSVEGGSISAHYESEDSSR